MTILARFLRVLGLVITVGALAACAPQASAQARAGTMNTSSVGDTLRELDQTPDRPVRVIVTVRPGTADQVVAATRKAGATVVQPLAGTQSIVIEGKAAHVRAAVATGQVLQLQRDTPSPTN